MSRAHTPVLIGLGLLALAGCARGPGGEQTLVDRAALTVQELMTQTVSQDPKRLLAQAKAVMICPRVFKAGFFIGGEGGSCVMLSRTGNGTWSYPTFYDIGSGSFGFQFGVQDSQLMLLVMTNRGLTAVMDSQVRLGGNVSVAVATLGAGVQGSTTTAVGADIIAFSAARGLFGGVSLEGGVMSARVDENQAYYGQPLVARQILLQMQGVNPGADPLREVLTRYGAGGDGPSAAPAMGEPSAYPPSYQPAAASPGAPAAQPRYQPPAMSSPSYRPPSAPAYQAPAATAPNAGYQPPPGQFTYPPVSGTGGNGPIQQQSLPPPAR